MQQICKIAMVAAIVALCAQPAYAAEPLKSYMELKDGRHLFIKTYEAAPDENPSQLKEEPFELDGFSYSFLDMEKDEIISEEKRMETQEKTTESETNDLSAVLEQLPLSIDYNKDGFTGKLLLDSDSVSTQVKGYTTKTYTVKDSIMLRGVSNNDVSLVPKTTVKNGVTLKLTGVDWSVGSSAPVDYDSVPISYNGVASYSGSYTKKIPTGYMTTAVYSGEVVNRTVDSVVYTVTYIGEKLPVNIWGDTDGGIPVLAIVCGVGLVLLQSVAAFFLLYPNAVVLIKEGEDYRKIGRRRVKYENPVVDLSRYDVAGQEVAVKIKQQAANRLFGRQVKTVADGGYCFKCLVDQKDRDFWYVVNIPAQESPDAENEDGKGGNHDEN